VTRNADSARNAQKFPIDYDKNRPSEYFGGGGGLDYFMNRNGRYFSKLSVWIDSNAAAGCFVWIDSNAASPPLNRFEYPQLKMLIFQCTKKF